MDQTERKPMNPELEMICPGDPRVCVLLGRQKRPAEGGIRRSRFVFSLYADGRYLVFHTLTRRLLLLPVTYVDYLTGEKLYPVSILEDAVLAQLYEWHFLVPEDEPEAQTYLELKDVLVVKEELPRGITHYVILPTTTCNARCFYCFEQGMRYRKMSPETVEDTLRFILSHRPKDSKKIHIHWFGGEPMCAPENIDRICDGLTEAGVEYTAEMTSNGSLFTEELARKAAEKWKLGSIQITLDGMAEEYARRKRYTAALKEPFEMVIRSMHLLIAAGIGVTVRLNTDENNLSEIYRCVDYLADAFSEDERKKLLVYAHSLFGQPGEGLDGCPVGIGPDALEERVLEINDYIARKGLRFRDLGPLFSLKSHYCMVTAPECNVLIDAEGRLFACDAMPESMRYGDVKQGIDPEAWAKVSTPCEVRDVCRECVFLPQCTEFHRCPNMPALDACRRQEQRKLEGALRSLYADYLIQKEKKRQESAAAAANDPSAKEAEDVQH